MVLIARAEADLITVATPIKAAGGVAHVFASDLTHAAATSNVAQRILLAHRIPDLLVNNTGTGRWLIAKETLEEDNVMIALHDYLWLMPFLFKIISWKDDFPHPIYKNDKGI